MHPVVLETAKASASVSFVTVLSRSAVPLASNALRGSAERKSDAAAMRDTPLLALPVAEGTAEGVAAAEAL